MSEATVFESRASKLEQDNRRLKLTVGALLLALAAAAVMSQRIPELIQARRFEVVDVEGTSRVHINEVGIAYSDYMDSLRATIGAGGIVYFDENGTIRAVDDRTRHQLRRREQHHPRPDGRQRHQLRRRARQHRLEIAQVAITSIPNELVLHWDNRADTALKLISGV